MPARFSYSRWDGTQTGFDLDGGDLLGDLADDLLYHGDVDAALRRRMHEGFSRDGERVAGLRELMQRLRSARNERLERSDLGGVYAEIAAELDDIVDEERHAVDNARRDGENSGDERRAESAKAAAEDRNLRLDLLPSDLAGKVRELQAYDFTSSEAQHRFDALMERLRSQLANQMFEQVSGAMSSMTPESIARMKDMLAALNEMLERRGAGADPRFEQFMDRFGDFFPDHPESLDELLEQMARQMAAAQAMLNSMTPEQRAQLQSLSEQLLSDMDLRQQMQQLSSQLRAQFPQLGWNQSYDFRGDEQMGMSEALEAMRELGDLDQLENLLRHATSPSALAEVDIDRAKDLLGDDAARSLSKLAELTKALAEAGLIDQREGRTELTPKGLRRIGAQALDDLFSNVMRDRLGQHELRQTGTGHERTGETKRYEFGDPFQLDLERTIRNAISRHGTGTPVRLSPDDFEIERIEHLTRSATVLMLDLSLSMEMRGNFLPAKKVAMALHSLISSQFPRDYLGLIAFSRVARVIEPRQLPEASWDYEYGTNMHHGFTLARHMLSRQSGSKQIIMITDGEPTAHITPSGDAYFNYPTVTETVEATMREVLRCTRDEIRINTFMLDASSALVAFVERMTELNRGRAFFTTPETLGDYVLVEFMADRRRTTSRRRAG